MKTMKPPRRRVRQTAWGNIYGYEGSRKVAEFGTDVQAAEEWVGHKCPELAGIFGTQHVEN